MATSRARLPVATAAQFEGATLMRVTQSNVRRVRYIDISLDRELLVIGGDNAQGKTSFLDGIMIGAAAKKSDIKLNPIHNGQQEGEITLYFGDGENVTLKITKTLSRVGESQWTQDIDIEIPGFMAPSRVEEFLRELVGDLTFDPLAFDNMKAAEQLEIIRSLVTGFDFEANQKEYDAVYSERTTINRDQKKAQAAADAIVLGPKPTQGASVDELTAKLRKAADDNLDTERRRANRETYVARINTLREQARAKLAEIGTAVQREVDACNEFVSEQQAQIQKDEAHIEQLRAQINALQQQIGERQRRIAAREQGLQGTLKTTEQTLRCEADALTKKADDLQAELDAAGELPELVNVAEIEAQLKIARDAKDALDEWERQRKRKAEFQAEADKLAADSDDLSARLAELLQEKHDAIAKAHLPVDGLGIAADHITLNGLAWNEASEAERIDASTAIAMALNPKLKVILIRAGSGVGTKIRERIRKRAAERGYRVLMEVYDETGDRSHIFIEDGVVKQLDKKEQAA